MKRWFSLWKAENKRAWKVFPEMLLQAIVLALAAGAVAFCAARILYQGQLPGIRAAVVMEEENPLTEFAYEYVKEAEKDVEFVRCSREEALAGLEKGEFAAVILLGEDLVEGILNGENPSVVVLCSEGLSAAGAFLKELTQAGAAMLSTAQAEIYAVSELAGELGAEEGIVEIQNRININNLNMALGRSGLFDYREVSATGNLSVPVYYLASAVTALFLFLGFPMGMFLKQDKVAAIRQYRRAGIREGGQQAARWLTVFGIYSLITAVIFVLLRCFGISEMQITAVWLIAGSIAAFVLMVYEAVERRGSAVLVLAFLTAVLLFLSGGIVPKVFFPKNLRAAAQILPSSFWVAGMGEALAGKFSWKDIGGSVLYGMFFFGISVYFRHRRVRQTVWRLVR